MKRRTSRLFQFDSSDVNSQFYFSMILDEIRNGLKQESSSWNKSITERNYGTSAFAFNTTTTLLNSFCLLQYCYIVEKFYDLIIRLSGLFAILNSSHLQYHSNSAINCVLQMNFNSLLNEINSSTLSLTSSFSWFLRTEWWICLKIQSLWLNVIYIENCHIHTIST